MPAAMMKTALTRSRLSLAEHGAVFYPKTLQADEIDELRDLCGSVIGAKPGARIYVAGGLKAFLAPDRKIGRIACGLIGDQAKPVRAIVFDKSAATNWALGWHQDRTICVRDRRDVEGFGPWTVKAGSLHVEPPFAVIRQMITLRIHLDDVDETNAPLLIVPGSQALGRIPAAACCGRASTPSPEFWRSLKGERALTIFAPANTTAYPLPSQTRNGTGRPG